MGIDPWESMAPGGCRNPYPTLTMGSITVVLEKWLQTMGYGSLVINDLKAHTHHKNIESLDIIPYFAIFATGSLSKKMIGSFIE